MFRKGDRGGKVYEKHPLLVWISFYTTLLGVPTALFHSDLTTLLSNLLVIGAIPSGSLVLLGAFALVIVLSILSTRLFESHPPQPTPQKSEWDLFRDSAEAILSALEERCKELEKEVVFSRNTRRYHIYALKVLADAGYICLDYSHFRDIPVWPKYLLKLEDEIRYRFWIIDEILNISTTMDNMPLTDKDAIRLGAANLRDLTERVKERFEEFEEKSRIVGKNQE